MTPDWTNGVVSGNDTITLSASKAIGTSAPPTTRSASGLYPRSQFYDLDRLGSGAH